MSAVPNASHIDFLGLVPKGSASLYASGDGQGSQTAQQVPCELVSMANAAGVSRPTEIPVKTVDKAVEPSPPSSQITRPQSHTPRGSGEASASSRAFFRTDSTKQKLHRIGEVRLSQGVSERTMCRRLNIDVKQLRAIEEPSADLSLSQLAVIREALEVPFADLLVENDQLSRPVQERAKLLKIMKTAVSLKECKLPPRATRLAQMLCEQLIDLMPELSEVGGWPEFGSRRGSDSVARILESEIDTSNLKSD